MHRETRAFIRKRIAEHMDTFDEDNMRDFIDLYLKTEKSGETSGAMTGMNTLGSSNILFGIMTQVVYKLVRC